MEQLRKKASRTMSLGRLEALRQLTLDSELSIIKSRLNSIEKKEQELLSKLSLLRGDIFSKIERDKVFDPDQYLRSKNYIFKLTEELSVLTNSKQPILSELEITQKKYALSCIREKSFERMTNKYDSLHAAGSSRLEQKEQDLMTLLLRKG